MFNIGRKEVVISYFAYALKFLSSLIVLPFILTSISTEDFAIWSIFLAINTLVLLLDMGYGVVISRYAMYAYSGSESVDIDSETKPVVSDSPNYILLYQIMLTSTKIYKKLTIFAFFGLILMSIYLVVLTYTQPNFTEIMGAWAIYFISVCINVYILSEATVLKGLGKIKELQTIVITNSLFGIFLKIFLLEIGLQLIGLSLAYLITAAILAIQYFRNTNKVRKEKYQLFLDTKINFEESFVKTYESIRIKSKAMGGVVLSNFIQNQLFLLIAPIFLSLKIMGSYSLTWQLVSLIGAVASVPFNTYLMKMGNQMVSKEFKALKETFSIATFIFIFIFIIGSIGLVFLGYNILALMDSNTELLSRFPLILLLLYGFMNQSIIKSTNVISLSNNQDFVKSMVISSLLIILLQVMVMSFTSNLGYIFSVNILILSSYNYWKWGSKAFKLCNLTFWEMTKIPISKLLNKAIPN